MSGEIARSGATEFDSASSFADPDLFRVVMIEFVSFLTRIWPSLLVVRHHDRHLSQLFLPLFVTVNALPPRLL